MSSSSEPTSAQATPQNQSPLVDASVQAAARGPSAAVAAADGLAEFSWQLTTSRSADRWLEERLTAGASSQGLLATAGSTGVPVFYMSPVSPALCCCKSTTSRLHLIGRSVPQLSGQGLTTCLLPSSAFLQAHATRAPAPRHWANSRWNQLRPRLCTRPCASSPTRRPHRRLQEQLILRRT